jgi:hypothetical protein
VSGRPRRLPLSRAWCWSSAWIAGEDRSPICSPHRMSWSISASASCRLAGANALAQNLAFELGEHSQQCSHGAAGRRFGVSLPGAGRKGASGRYDLVPLSRLGEDVVVPGPFFAFATSRVVRFVLRTIAVWLGANCIDMSINKTVSKPLFGGWPWSDSLLTLEVNHSR